jgi:hypothetical protein
MQSFHLPKAKRKEREDWLCKLRGVESIHERNSRGGEKTATLSLKGV